MHLFDEDAVWKHEVLVRSQTEDKHQTLYKELKDDQLKFRGLL